MSSDSVIRAVGCKRLSGIAGRDNRRCLHHQDDCALSCARAMNDALWHDITMPGLQVNRLPFEVNDEVPIKDKEELVISVAYGNARASDMTCLVKLG
jgi:hypothetical protein